MNQVCFNSCVLVCLAWKPAHSSPSRGYEPSARPPQLWGPGYIYIYTSRRLLNHVDALQNRWDWRWEGMARRRVGAHLEKYVDGDGPWRWAWTSFINSTCGTPHCPNGGAAGNRQSSSITNRPYVPGCLAAGLVRNAMFRGAIEM